MKAIGKVCFDRNQVLKVGLCGTIFKGKFEDAVDVAVQRVENVKFFVDLSILWKSQNHSNVVRYYGTESDPAFQ